MTSDIQPSPPSSSKTSHGSAYGSNVHAVSALEAMTRMGTQTGAPGGFSAIIDARSEDEFTLDHLPGAINWPSLNNEQRILIGTLYKQVGAFEAKKHGEIGRAHV